MGMVNGTFLSLTNERPSLLPGPGNRWPPRVLGAVLRRSGCFKFIFAVNTDVQKDFPGHGAVMDLYDIVRVSFDGYRISGFTDKPCAVF